MTELEFTADQRLSLLIHARSKIGKSTLSSTAPQPILVLDAEGSWRFIPLRKTSWNPYEGPPPEPDGTWDACVVTVQDWQTVLLIYQYLSQTQTGFTSVVLDSITELQSICKTNLRGTETMRIQDWGSLLVQMDQVIRAFRDLNRQTSSSIRCVVYISETTIQENNQNRLIPSMQGRIKDRLPYFVDICGYLYADHELDQNGQPTREVRRLYFGPHQQFESGERVQGLLGTYQTIEKPFKGTVGTDIIDWMRTIYNS